jgi:PKD repeat protein
VINLPPLIAEGCAPLLVVMPDMGITDPVSYLWHFGDGTASTNAHPTHTYPAGTYWVTLSVMTPAGCTSSATSPGEVIAHPAPDAAFTADPWSTDIDHSLITFTDGSSSDVTSYD